jgi:hypothetical protein
MQSIFLILWKHLLKPHQISVTLSFSLIGRFSLMFMHGRLSKQFSRSQAAFGTTFRVAGGYRKAGTSFLKRVITGLIFTISKWLYRSKQKLIVLHKKKAINRENLQHSYKKYGLIFRTFKNYFSSDTIMLKSSFGPSTKYFSRDTILWKGKLLGVSELHEELIRTQSFLKVQHSEGEK